MKPRLSIASHLLAAACSWSRLRLLIPVATAMIVSVGTAHAANVDPKSLKDYGISTLDFPASPMSAFATITKVESDSPASVVGVQPNDLLIRIGSSGWSDPTGLTNLLNQVPSKGVVDITIQRNAVPIQIKLVSSAIAATFLNKQGFMLGVPTTKKFPVTASSGGAAGAGIRPGDQILKLDGQDFESPVAFNDRFYKALNDNGHVRIQVQQGANGIIVEVDFPVLSAPIGVTRGVGDGSKGPPVDYPQFLEVGPAPPDLNAGQQNERSNEVIAARVELYYFRDAHRVAQIINRRVKSYNGPAVTAAEQAAEKSRSKFEEERLDRRQKEFDAEQAASQLRAQETKLAATVGVLRSVLQKKQNVDQLATEIADIDNQLAKIDADLTANPPPIPATVTTLTAQKNQLNAEKKSKEAQKTQLDNEIKTVAMSTPAGGSTANSAIADLKASITQLIGDIDTQRKLVAAKQNDARKAEDEEQLAAKDQFRREVGAAKTDPDTYVPGDRNNVDPVSQVSISVIGEGVLHLRGPRKGVVKVREMINQIDHPVGQVKIGVMTVQVNGENGARMENTLKRVEGNISRGRFLTATAGQFLLRSVQEVAHEAAQAHPGARPDQRFAKETEDALNGGKWSVTETAARRQRWQRYVHAFFGADFLEELYDVDPTLSLLDPLNKLLSMNSNDSLTLAEALVLTGLAKGEYRRAILERFDQYIQCELPQREGQWIVTTGAHKCYDPRWWGDANKGRNKVFEDGSRKYKFQAVKAIYERTICPQGYDDGDRMNAFQRSVVKLVQGMSLELGLHYRRDAMVQKRALVTRMRNGGRPTLTEVQFAYLDEQIAKLEEQHLDSQDALRGQKASIDKLIKQIVVAMEDDVYAQFYDPALERVRKAAQEWDVEMSQIERTTILTNNRAFAKVSPQASFEFDLPKRDIAIAEALKAAYALHKDLGPLLADPEFGTLAKMFAGQSIGGGVADGTVKNVIPGLNSTDQQQLLYADSAVPPKFGTELEKLIPNPAIYKFETGTGYEVRPVIQPDGQSVAFDFNYLYTTDLLEPTRPDERSLGRVKRHFVNTEVQLGNLEWREISRYEVALKAARNSRGVPLLEDVPVAGVLFRPLPQAKKSIQKNIIIGQATIYPTIQDLLGLRPASQAYLDHQKIAEDGYDEFKKEHARLHELNVNLDGQINAMIRGECPPNVPFCPRVESKTPGVPLTPTSARTPAPAFATPASNQQRTAPRAPKLLPEAPAAEFVAPAPITPEVIQPMSYQKPAARPTTPAATRRVK